jgi:hypothetical protein
MLVLISPGIGIGVSVGVAVLVAVPGAGVRVIVGETVGLDEGVEGIAVPAPPTHTFPIYN